MAKYTYLIPQNTALPQAKKITVINPDGKQVGTIALGGLTMPQAAEKLYSFGALSDVHFGYDTAEEDFPRALTYLNQDASVAFTCICGDLTRDGTEEELAQYKAVVDSHSPDTPVYAISGNHEAANGKVVTDESISPYTEQPLYYSFVHGNDVFIMCGYHQLSNEYMFADGQLQWLYETLEINRDKRCFVFFHVFPWGDSGNPGELYWYDMFTGTRGSVFQSLLKHYKNTIFFHGHSHTKFDQQKFDPKANYSDVLGYRSVHIPSVTIPRDIEYGYLRDLYEGSEGYVVDVYQNGIMLRGRDFVKETFLPIATYWLDTTLQTVEAGTYIDNTDTVKNAELKYRLHGDKSNYIVDGVADGSTGGVVAPVSYIDGIRVWEINEDAFKDNTDIRVVILPETVGYTTVDAFGGCTNLEMVTFKRNTTDGSFNLSSATFRNCPNLKTINVPWAEGAVSGAPWGATNATINYNYTSQ